MSPLARPGLRPVVGGGRRFERDLARRRVARARRHGALSSPEWTRSSISAQDARTGFEAARQWRRTRAALERWLEVRPPGDAALDREWRRSLEGEGPLAHWLSSLAPAGAWHGDIPLETLLAAQPFPQFRAVGYWRDQPSDGLPDPGPLCRCWPFGSKDARALSAGFVVAQWRGCSWCRAVWWRRGPCADAKMGSADLSDGVFVWPEGLSHYVTVHRLRLPEWFLERVGSTTVAPQVQEALRGLPSVLLRYDFTEWRAWASEQGCPGARPRTADRHGWFVGLGADERGPFDDAELEAMVERGQVTAESQVSRHGLGMPRLARDMPQVAAWLRAHGKAA
ncbi:MAG: DUF4339 domain-containing protein [Myxococcales bacterium]